MPRRFTKYERIVESAQRGGPGSIKAARRELWRVCRGLMAGFDHAMAEDDDEAVLKFAYRASHALSAFIRAVNDEESLELSA